MPALLLRGRLGDLRVPPPAQLLDGRDVHRAVVEVLLNFGQLGGQEAPVGADGVPGQGDGAGLGDVQLEELQRLRPGLLERQGRGGDGLEKPGPGVHGGDEVVHFGQLRRSGVHHQIGAFGHDRQIVVGDQTGDLDDDVAGGIQSGHLEIHPGQHGRACYRPPPGACGPL